MSDRPRRSHRLSRLRGDTSSLRYPRLISCGIALLCVVSATRTARSEPQVNVGVQPGLCVPTGGGSSAACMSLELQGDVMLGRRGAGDVGWGPALGIGTAGFDDLRLRAGPSVQLPLDTWQLVVTPAPYLRVGSPSEGGVGFRAFLGSRSYNHTGNYVAAFGLVLGMDVGLGGLRERNFVVAAQLDAMWMAIPWLVLASWLRSP